MPKKPTRRDRLIAGLEKLGYTRDRITTSTKYAVFLPPREGGLNLDGHHRVLVGKLSIRYTRSQIVNSVKMSDRLVNFILEQAT